MTYNSSPNSGQSLGQTRDQMRTNTDLLKASLAINHVDLGLADVGKHKFVEMPVQASAPTTAAGELALFSKTVSAISQLYIIRDGVAGTEKPLTAGDTSQAQFAVNTVAYAANCNGGWTFLPGGMILQYGRRTTPTASGAVTFPIPFPSGNAPFSIVVTNERDSARSANINNTGISSTGFSYFMETSGAIALNWIAIGN